MIELTNRQLRTIKAMAQRLDPMLRIGRNGLSSAFLKSADETLAHHELVKIKFDEFKEQKKELAAQLATATSSLVVMRVGHVVVLYRQQPDVARRVVKL
ncbi:MAG: YhbY family RNA-binding protein [Pedosphaera sp.]|nr:YhbY family RNA-binding protein [Pedosphaera sp.]